METSRRILLAGLPGLAGLAPLTAGAFRLEGTNAAMAADYDAASACQAPQTHDVLRAEIEALFEGRPLPPMLAPQLAALTRCPFCGCGVVGATDHGERAG